jgi:hypothetical protein
MPLSISPGVVMRAAPFACVVVIVVVAGPAFGDSSLLNTVPTDPAWNAPPAVALPTSGAPPSSSDQHGGPWAVDVLFGLPLGIRAQRVLGTDSDGLFRLEAFVGTYIIIPTVGAGLRMNLPCIRGDHLQFIVAPGIDVYQTIVDHPFLAGDVDLVWRRDLANGFQGEWGVKLGYTVEVGGSRHFQAPLIAFFGGFEF